MVGCALLGASLGFAVVGDAVPHWMSRISVYEIWLAGVGLAALVVNARNINAVPATKY